MRRSAARRRSRWASSATRRPGRRSSPRWATPIAFAAWSIRQAIRRLKAWDAEALVAALLDPKRQDDALKLADEAWAVPVVNALTMALERTDSAATRARILETLAGLYRQYPEWSGNWFGTNPLAGQFPSKTKDWDPAGMEGVLLGLALARGTSTRASGCKQSPGSLPSGRRPSPCSGPGWPRRVTRAT